MTVVLRDDFESGDLSGYTIEEDTPSISTARAHSGINSVLMVNSSGVESLRRVISPTKQILVARLWVNADVVQNDSTFAFEIKQTSPSRGVQIQTLNTPTRFSLRGNVGAGDVTLVDPGSSTAIVADTWHRLDLGLDATSDPWTARWAVDGVEQTSANPSGGGTPNLNSIKFGMWYSLNSWTTYFDDFSYADSLADFPINESLLRSQYLDYDYSRA